MDVIKLKHKLLKTAIASRAFIWTLAFVADLLVPNHDAGVFTWTIASTIKTPTWGDRIVSWFTDGLTQWDGQYFMHVANHGYTYENTLAFFPGYPLLVKIAAEILYWLQVDYGLIQFPTALKLAGILVNLGLFVFATLALYELTWRLFKDEYLAYKSALFFCINPASIFFSATYSESLHAALSFYLMAKLEKGFSFKVGLVLALASFNRSNALLNLGFIWYKALKIIVNEVMTYQWLKQLKKQEFSTTLANIIGDGLFPGIFCSVASIIPFGLVQWYGYTQFCGLTKVNLDFDELVVEYAVNQSLKLPSQIPSEWCSYLIPMPYSYIQSHYWNVGFLRYFHWKQIPNFALAAPMISLVLYFSWKFVCHHRQHCLTLGFAIGSGSSSKSNYDTYGAKTLPKECFVYVVHAAFIAVFGLFCIHVQVFTRMMASSTPVIYWWLAVLSTPNDRKPQHVSKDSNSKKKGHAANTTALVKNNNIAQIESEENMKSSWKNLVFDERYQMPKIGVWLMNYFVLYACLGTIMFVNFLPWT